MSEAGKIDRAGRRRRAEARLARSRPAREAAAATHAGRLGYSTPEVREPDRASALSRLEAKVLDAANEILVSRGGEGPRIAEMIRDFIDVQGSPSR